MLAVSIPASPWRFEVHVCRLQMACNCAWPSSSPRSLVSNFEVGAFGHAAGNASPVRATTEVFQRQRVEPLHRLFVQLEPERPHDLVAEGAAGRIADRVI